MQLQQGLWEHLRTLHNAWSSFWFIARWRWYTGWCSFLWWKKSRSSGSWPLLDQCVNITCLVRAVSPFLVGHVHVHTLTCNIQAVGGQRGKKKARLRGPAWYFRLMLYFSVLWCGCFWRLHFFFPLAKFSAGGGFKVTSSMIQSVWTGFVMMLTQAERCILPPTKAK